MRVGGGDSEGGMRPSKGGWGIVRVVGGCTYVCIKWQQTSTSTRLMAWRRLEALN